MAATVCSPGRSDGMWSCCKHCCMMVGPDIKLMPGVATCAEAEALFHDDHVGTAIGNAALLNGEA